MFFCKRAAQKSPGLRTLCDLRVGEKAVVRSLNTCGGCQGGRLAAMGITPGTELEMLSNGRGPLMVLVRSSRLCLCRNLAQSIIIE